MGINIVLVVVCLQLYMKSVSLTTQWNDFGKVYYNSFLSTLILTPLVLSSGKLHLFLEDGLPRFDGNLLLLFALNGLSGLCISFGSFWMVQVTSPIAYRYD